MPRPESIKDLRFLIFGIWLVLTLFNLFKAVHIDDTFHIEVARHIITEPLSPLSAEINWTSQKNTIYHSNQPPLFFYMMALVIRFFGESLVALHLLVAVFTFLSLHFFARLCLLLEVEHSRYMILLFGLNPIVLVNQNIMLDIPLMAMILGASYSLLVGLRKDSTRHILYSMVFLSLGLLIKFSMAPILILAFIGLWSSSKRKKLIYLLIPISTLVLWSVWNLIEFGQIQLLNREVKDFDSWKIWSFLCACGALFPFILLLLAKWRFSKGISILYLMLILSISYLDFEQYEILSFSPLELFFVLQGLLLNLTLFWICGLRVHSVYSKDERIIAWAFVLTSIFVVLFTPFIASRHLLLILPFSLLLMHEMVFIASPMARRITLALTISMTLLIGYSDFQLAGYYRDMATDESLKEYSPDWSIGHWGWRYYTEEQGIRAFDLKESDLSTGDILAIAKGTHKQQLPSDMGIRVTDKLWRMPRVNTLLSVTDNASMYHTYPHRPPWKLMNAPIDTILIGELLLGEDWVIERIKRDKNWYREVKKKALDLDISVDSMLIMDARWVMQDEKMTNE